MIDSAALINKLQIKSRAKLWLVNVPDEVAEALTASGEIATVKTGAAFDGVIAYCESPADVAKVFPSILRSLPPDGLLWFAYRKGAAAKASGLSRDAGWGPVEAANWRPVRSIAIDDNWTGLRFKPVDLVSSKTPDAWRTRGKAQGEEKS